MKLTPLQHQALVGAIELLRERLHELDEQWGARVPPDNRLDLLFTDMDDYPEVDQDVAVNAQFFFIWGLALGLGLTYPADLYQAYVAGVEIVPAERSTGCATASNTSPASSATDKSPSKF